MKALLVHPKCPKMTFWSMEDIIKKFTDKKAGHIPLALLTVASMLPEDWILKLVDENVKELTDDDILWANIVLVSAMLIQKKRARKIISRCNELKKTVIAGGPFFTTCDDEELKGVDHVLQGEVEDTMPIFLEDLKKGTAKRIYPSPAKRPDIKKSPIPKWDLINPGDYVSGAIQSARGCPHDCEFCDVVAMYGKIPRVKDPEQVIAEIQALYEAGFRGAIFFADDNLIGNKIMVKKILRQLIGWQRQYDYPFHFFTQVSIDLALDDELLGLLRDAGFREVFIGIESVSIESLEECGKFQNLKTMRDMPLIDSVKKIQEKYGIQVMVSLIIGFDHDPPDNAKRLINFVRRVKTPIVQLSRLCALRGTRLYNRLKKAGRIKGFATGENTDGYANIRYSDDVEKGFDIAFKEVFTTIYSEGELYERIWNLVKSLPPNTRGRALNSSGIKTLLKSLWEIGILGKGRRLLFWKLIAKTLLFSRRNFPVLIKHLIFGEHLMKIAERFRG